MGNSFFIENALKRFDKNTREDIIAVYEKIRDKLFLFIDEPDDYEGYQLDQATLHASISIVTGENIKTAEKSIDHDIAKIAKKLVYSINPLNGFVA